MSSVYYFLIQLRFFFFFFFFQAEDGIRDLTVTGVQTCALPIYPYTLVLENRRRWDPFRRRTLLFAMVLAQLPRTLWLLGMDELSLDHRLIDNSLRIPLPVMEVSSSLHNGKHLLLQCLAYRRVRLLVRHHTDSSSENMGYHRTRDCGSDKTSTRCSSVCLAVRLPQSLWDT